MTKDEFMRLWSDKTQPRTVIFTEEGRDEQLKLIVCFPPNKIAISPISLYIAPNLTDPF